MLQFGRDLPGGGRELRWVGPALMGVVNVTPDSFSDGGDNYRQATAITTGLRQLQEGALIIDVGGESTRPGAVPLPAEVEIARVLPVVSALAAAGAVVSIDSRNPVVAEAALAEGASLVNDVGGLRLPAMRQVAAQAGAPVIIMHMQGEPRSMQDEPKYGDVVSEVKDELLSRAATAREEGVPDLVIDPGIGFGKTVEHNLELFRRLRELTNGPELLLIGASRKSIIGAVSGEGDPKRRLPGTLALHLSAAGNGAALLRVHDVAEHAQALSLWAAVR